MGYYELMSTIQAANRRQSEASSNAGGEVKTRSVTDTEWDDSMAALAELAARDPSVRLN